MRNATIVGLLVSFLILSAISGCGGGDDDGTSTPTKAVVRLSTQGVVDGPEIKGVEVSLILPAGVTVKADETGKPDDGVVVASGVASGGDSYSSAEYSPAGAAANGVVKIALVKTSGFAAGEFVTVNCDLAAGTTVTASDFGSSDFNAVDADGNPIDGLTIGIATELR